MSGQTGLDIQLEQSKNNPACKYWFKFARCDKSSTIFFQSKLIPTDGSVVEASHSELGDMGLILAGQ